MRGRAYEILTAFRASLSGAGAAFAMSRLILRARIIPENITPDLDDPAVEQRLTAAIAVLNAESPPQAARGGSGKP
jgi:hypothetical protein